MPLCNACKSDFFSSYFNVSLEGSRSLNYTQLEVKYNNTKINKTFNVGNKSTNNENMFSFQTRSNLTGWKRTKTKHFPKYNHPV